MVCSLKSEKSVLKYVEKQCFYESIFHLAIDGIGTVSFIYQRGNIDFTEVKDLA